LGFPTRCVPRTIRRLLQFAGGGVLGIHLVGGGELGIHLVMAPPLADLDLAGGAVSSVELTAAMASSLP
jgi:hypothetical protein